MRRPNCRESRPSLRNRARFGSAAAALFATTALAPLAAMAQTQSSEAGAANEVDSVLVTGAAAAQQPDLTAEQIQRRDTSSVADLLEQISGVSLNSLYSRPDVSVGVQGIAGHGRVVQQLEGISQNFHAFTADVGQTGSIFIDPMLLAGIDVTRGGTVGTATLGGLGGAVNFRYMDVDDILEPGETFGGLARMSTGVGYSANGQKPAGSAFVAGRTGRLEWMAGGAYVDNDAYRVGSNFSMKDMAENFRGDNLKFYDGVNDIKPAGGCDYTGITGMVGSATRDGLSSCRLSSQQLTYLKQAADSGALDGTEKRTYSAILRLGYDFGDAANQRLDLFAVTSGARYRTEQAPSVRLPGAWDGGQTGDPAYWGDDPWDVGTDLKSTVVSLQYGAAFSELFNPKVRAYFERQKRDQDWVGLSGSYAYGVPLYYDVENKSFGLKLDNASHFTTRFTGPLRLDVGLEARRMDKSVQSLTEWEYLKVYQATLGNDITVPKWDPDARTDTISAAVSLSTEGSGPLQVTAGFGWQHVDLTVYDPVYQTGNHQGVGTNDYVTQLATLRAYYRSLGYSSSVARTMAIADLDGYTDQWYIEPGQGVARYVTGDRKHDFDLKSGHFSLEYRPEGTGLTGRAQVSYNERAPTSNEMYSSGVWNLVMFVTNPDLKPEKNLSVQVGADYARSGLFGAEDRLKIGAIFYRNMIDNYIGYGPIASRDSYLVYQSALAIATPSHGGIASVNNLETVVRQGFEVNLDYSRPLFNLRGAVTLPLRRDNKMCSWYSPSGRSYVQTTNADSTSTYTEGGHADRLCYSGWNWMETSLIQPVTGAFTATFTPMGDRLELGATAHYRGRQRSAYYYVEGAQADASRVNSLKPLPDGDGWLTVNLFPKVVKFDLFANYKVTKDVKLGLYVANVTNEMEATPTTFGYNFYPGRTLKASMEVRF
ncbi:MAG: TonB-dependent receptor [Caulobacter sp.]